MDFHTALSTGAASIEFITDEFAEAFLKAVMSAPENWIAGVSHHFVGQCFRLLGLRFAVSVRDFSRTQDHPYRNDNPNYIFHPSPKLMNDVRAFLKRLPVLLSKYASLLEWDMENCRFDRLTHPVSAYLRVVLIWMKVVQAICSNMQLTGASASDSFLCEPLARMSFYIMEGLCKLLPEYANFGGLRDMCLSLAVDVRYGIFYEATSQVVVGPMLDIFQDHYRTFCGVEKSALDFVYCILIVVMEEPDSYIDAYDFLETMLEQFAESGERDSSNRVYLRMLTNELITDIYMAVIFETLKTSKSKPLLTAVLKYLMTLQRHLVSAECFTIRFHEILLQLILRTPQASSPVSSMAAEVYVKLSQRKYQEREIAQHILETYIKSQYNPPKNATYAQFRSELSRYLKAVGQHFPALDRFEFYTFMLSTRNVRIELSLIAAQSVSIVFERLMAKYSTAPEALEQINQFLRCWPNLLQVASQTDTRGILFSIYGMVDFVAVAQRDKELLLILESFCLDIFLKDNTLSELEFRGLYRNICRSVNASGNDQIHTKASQTIQEEQTQFITLLNAPDTDDNRMVELLETYAESVRRLHSLLKVNKFPVHQVNDLYSTLANLLLEKRIKNDSLTRYGTESLAAMLVSLCAELNEANDELGVRISMLALQLLDFCKSELANSSLDLKRTKFLFCSCLILLIGNLPGLSLDDATYNTLLECLILAPRVVHSQIEGPLNKGYLAEMHFLFRQLIQWEKLPNNRIWKVLVQYKMPGKPSKFMDTELEKLLGVLLEHHIKGYIHCLPVILLHISNEKTKGKNRLSTVLTAHLSVIEKHATALDSWLLRLVVFQEVLQLLNRNMRARRLEVTSTVQRNRIAPLRNVLPLLASLCLQEEHFMNIAKSMHSLKEEALGPKETSDIESFITEISRFKYKCEDEQEARKKHENVQAAKEKDGNFNGKLIPLPPGPLNRWQHEALRVLENTDNALI